MPEPTWYIRNQGRVLGPFGLSQLKTLRDRGQLRRFHEVSEDRKAWTNAATIVGLFPAESSSKVVETAAEPVPETTIVKGDAMATLPAAANRAEWFYTDDAGAQQGPVTREKMLEMWHANKLQPTALAWKEGLANWAPVQDVLQLPARGVPRQTADVAAALRIFALDPVGGLPGACQALGPRWALVMGLGFQLFFDLCLLLGLAIGIADVTGGANLGDLVRDFGKLDSTTKLGIVAKLAFLAVLPLLCLSSAVTIVRTVTRGEGTWGYDVLIAGTALVPVALALPLIQLAGAKNWEVEMFLSLLCFCIAVLILNSGFTRIVKLPDRGAMLATPAALLLTAWLFKVLVTSVLDVPNRAPFN